MAKFKAGDMITDGKSVLMVNRVYIETHPYSLDCGQECYSLDNGSGFSEARESAKSIDRDFKLCD